MKADLQERVRNSTWHEVVFFQLRSLSLPDAFEQEIENTEVKGQDILKATAERKRDSVKFETNVLVAALAVNATIENAYGIANRTIFEAIAVQSTIKEVTTKQAESFATMKSELGFGTQEILKYLKFNLIRDYSDARMAIQLDFTGV